MLSIVYVSGILLGSEKKNHFILVEVEEQRKQIGKKKITKENKVYHLVVSAQRIDMGNRSAGGPRQ